ncbi:enediyne antibiotic chromoprotein [Streptomyces jeddahensis]|uniref:Antitumor antibiotic C-1027 apoprotein n=1 Tax=Streptomyces jeddahensis TaxID=1716141 RepID=A0A177HJ10_9ACTN|nr:enediyne antibiotic chromoprotein [Streptomyces jeddahensis]OAH10915.1 antitumor antibiotic C-1027 apoprotein precursor [Streptomyces jeddahensis]
MQIRSRLTKAGMLGAAAVAALAFSAAPASAAPAVTASPSSGLADGQSVTVTGTGFPAGAQVAVSQCRESTTCTDTLSTATVGADGRFTANYSVRKQFTATDWSTGSTVTVDCAAQQCQLVAYQEATGPVGTNISFG